MLYSYTHMATVGVKGLTSIKVIEKCYTLNTVQFVSSYMLCAQITTFRPVLVERWMNYQNTT